MTYPHNPLPEWLQFEDEELGMQPIPATGYPDYGMTLYLYSAPNSASGSFPLFIQGSGLSLTAPLYIKGGGTLVTKSTTLYVKGGGNPVATGIPLYLEARGIVKTGLNLVVPGQKGLPVNRSIPLFINGGGSHTGLFKMASLYVNGGNQFTTPLHLFIKNTDTHVAFNSHLNLFTKSENSSLAKATTLFLDNTGQGSGLSMFIQGRGSGSSDPSVNSDGWNPYARTLNLFLKRKDFPATMSLFIKVSQDVNTGSVPLYTHSANLLNSNIPMSIPRVKSAPTTNNTDLVISGF